MRYGYINGKWLRAKRLHIWMWQLLYGHFDSEADVPDYNNQYAQHSCTPCRLHTTITEHTRLCCLGRTYFACTK